VIHYKFIYGGVIPQSGSVVTPPSYVIHRTVSDVAVKVYPLFYKQMVVEWSIPNSWGTATFNVFRSATEYGPWTKLNDEPITGNFFKDKSTQEYSKFNVDFYRVDAILINNKIISSFPTTWENNRNTFAEIRAREIQRRELLLLTKFVGVKSLVFRKRTFGARCPSCWDARIEKVIEDNCQVCLGTSFQGGYFPAYETLLQYDPTPNNAVLSYQGRVEPNMIPAWTISYPQLNVFDLVIRLPDFRIYRIDAMQTTELQAVVVRQILTLNELDKETVEFKLIKDLLPLEYQC
jgi:hypothetical protein